MVPMLTIRTTFAIVRSMLAFDRCSPSWLRFAMLCSLFLLTSVWLETGLMPLTRVVAQMCAWLLAQSGVAPLLHGDLITLNNFTVRIVLECTALHPMLIYSAFVLAQPGTVESTLAGLLAGCGMLFTVNILRIAAVTVVGARWPLFFEISHVYLGQIIMLLLVVVAAQVWLYISRSDADNPLPFLLRAALWGSILYLPWVTLNKFYYMHAIDLVVASIIKTMNSHANFVINRPEALYNHTFAIPFYLSLALASGGGGLTWRLARALPGCLAMVGWHILSRMIQVTKDLFGLTELMPLHIIFYLFGQFIVPIALWFYFFGVPSLLVRTVPGDTEE